jgi:trimethylamine--corrinoid protein Co-methyltransferase
MKDTMGIDQSAARPIRNEVFADEQIQMLHRATLEVLQDVGIKVESEEAVDIFEGAGAEVERSGKLAVVKLSPDIIEKCVASAPSLVTYHGREPKHDYVAAPGKIGFTTFGECIQIVDPVTRQLRSTTKADLGNITRVCDRLEEIVLVERPVGSLDQYAPTQALHNYEVMVANTSKHIFLGHYSAENSKRIAQMAAACVGGEDRFRKRPPVTAFVSPTSPLILGRMCCEVIIECARLGIGISPISMVLSGTTGPVTLAGTIVIHNAEVLSAIALAQLTVPGTACTYASMSAVMDLRFATPATGSVEHGLISAGVTQLVRSYNLPCWVGGGVSDSKLPDAQAAYEFSLSATAAALAGTHFVYGAGALESGLTFDYAKLIMDCEQAKRIQHYLKGIAVNDETMALDVIKAVGPGGHFLTHEHTLKNMRSLLSFDLFDRRNRSAWVSKMGGRDILERAYERASQILTDHEPAPLPDGAEEQMRFIIEQYESELQAVFASG